MQFTWAYRDFSLKLTNVNFYIRNRNVFFFFVVLLKGNDRLLQANYMEGD